MDVIIDKNDNYTYTYKLKKGISNIKGARRVLKDLNYPEQIIQKMQ
jgi:DNA mismatch repair ATPase MutS